jgi:glucosamine--fructose-6-phosphate aminotransferase (isomerizing)
LENTLIEQSRVASEYVRNNWSGFMRDAMEALEPWLNDVDQVYLCGCGDSHHAAIGLEFAFDLWSGRKIRSAPAMFMSRYLIPRLDSSTMQTLVIGISASGEVARTIEAIDLANDVGAITMAFTSNSESSLGKRAKVSLTAAVDSFPGPGLLSYLASLLMGYASCATLASEEYREVICACMDELPSLLDEWIPSVIEMGKDFVLDTMMETGGVFVAGGSLFGSAMFAAAKVIESVGAYAWAQELEEWAHLEYFCNPKQMPTWFLTAGGRTTSREQEIFEAAKVIGRRMMINRWEGLGHWSSTTREALAPLGLWAGPAACAANLAERMNEKPFRGFGGGRSSVEGGGASRIRSSIRLKSFRDLSD